MSNKANKNNKDKLNDNKSGEKLITLEYPVIELEDQEEQQFFDWFVTGYLKLAKDVKDLERDPDKLFALHALSIPKDNIEEIGSADPEKLSKYLGELGEYVSAVFNKAKMKLPEGIDPDGILTPYLENAFIKVNAIDYNPDLEEELNNVLIYISAKRIKELNPELDVYKVNGEDDTEPEESKSLQKEPDEKTKDLKASFEKGKKDAEEVIEESESSDNYYPSFRGNMSLTTSSSGDEGSGWGKVVIGLAVGAAVAWGAYKIFGSDEEDVSLRDF